LVKVKMLVVFFLQISWYFQEKQHFKWHSCYAKIKNVVFVGESIQNYFKKKTTTRLHSCYGLAICKRWANFSFLALLKKFDFV